MPPADDWWVYRRHRGPATMRVANLKVKSEEADLFRMPKDDGLIEAVSHFAQQQGFSGFAMGPDAIEIYESCSREDFVSALIRNASWHTHVAREPGLDVVSHVTDGGEAAAAWPPGAVRESRAVPRNCAIPIATLTVEAEPGYVDPRDHALRTALRELCEAKGFTAASVRVRDVRDVQELNPREDQRRHSGIASGWGKGMLDSVLTWSPGANTLVAWALLDLGESRRVKGLVTQGHHIRANRCVKEVSVEFGEEEWKMRPVVDSSGGVAKMAANTGAGDVSSKALVDFPLGPVCARYILVRPTKWSGGVCMRVGVRIEVGESEGLVVSFYRGVSTQQVLDDMTPEAGATLFVR